MILVIGVNLRIVFMRQDLKCCVIGALNNVCAVFIQLTIKNQQLNIGKQKSEGSPYQTPYYRKVRGQTGGRAKRYCQRPGVLELIKNETEIFRKTPFF
jgi:hypothetical protein